MSRGEYEINKSPKPLKDESFKSMVCALLVFLSICIIILLAALPWKTYSSKPAVAEKEKVRINENFFVKIKQLYYIFEQIKLVILLSNLPYN